MFHVIFCVYFLANFFVVFRLWLLLKNWGWWRLAPSLIVLICGLAWPISRFGLELDMSLLRPLAVLGAIWLFFFLYALMLLLLVDVFRLINLANFFPRLRAKNNPKLPFYVLGGIVGTSFCLILAGYFNAWSPKIWEFDLSRGSANTMKFAVLTDLHIGYIIDPAYLGSLAEIVNPHRPDALLFVGDLIDDHSPEPLELARSLAEFNAPLGAYLALGNHEYIARPMEKSLEILQEAGFKILRDDWTVLADKVLLIGRDDYSASRFSSRTRLNLKDIVAKIPEPARRKTLVVMDHQPRALDEAIEAGASLMLSGHTHNGQLWPFNFVVAWMYEVSYGHLKKGDTDFLVSAGAGTWGPPVRTSSRPDILIVTIALD